MHTSILLVIGSNSRQQVIVEILFSLNNYENICRFQYQKHLGKVLCFLSFIALEICSASLCCLYASSCHLAIHIAVSAPLTFCVSLPEGKASAESI